MCARNSIDLAIIFINWHLLFEITKTINSRKSINRSQKSYQTLKEEVTEHCMGKTRIRRVNKHIQDQPKSRKQRDLTDIGESAPKLLSRKNDAESMEAKVSTIGLRLLEEETLIGGSEDQTLSFKTKLLENQTYPLKSFPCLEIRQ